MPYRFFETSGSRPVLYFLKNRREKKCPPIFRYLLETANPAEGVMDVPSGSRSCVDRKEEMIDQKQEPAGRQHLVSPGRDLLQPGIVEGGEIIQGIRQHDQIEMTTISVEAEDIALNEFKVFMARRTCPGLEDCLFGQVKSENAVTERRQVTREFTDPTPNIQHVAKVTWGKHRNHPLIFQALIPKLR